MTRSIKDWLKEGIMSGTMDGDFFLGFLMGLKEEDLEGYWPTWKEDDDFEEGDFEEDDEEEENNLEDDLDYIDDDIDGDVKSPCGHVSMREFIELGCPVCQKGV